MSTLSNPECFDLVVIGAGLYGIASARTYLTLHPTSRIVVFDEGKTVGGTWSVARLYPDLKTNNVAPRYQFPDSPLDEKIYGVKSGEHISGEIVHRYLTDVARKTGVLERIRFESKVESVKERGGDEGWELSVLHEDQSYVVHAKKLILATGLTSRPNMPVFHGQDAFEGPIFHTRDFSKHAESIDTVKNIVIIGASKSAHDVAWSYAKAGATVNMIIRPSGNGPVWMSPSLVTPLKQRLEGLLHTRVLSWFSPCPFGAEDGWGRVRSFLHGTWLGRKITDAFWAIIRNDVETLSGWDTHPEFKKLKPRAATFWTGTALGIWNYEGDWRDLVKKGRIHIFEADIEKLAYKRVYLDNGDVLEADVVVCATGWLKEPSINFLDTNASKLELGTAEEAQEKLKAKADSKIFTMYPRLRDQPEIGEVWKEKEPFRLYRFMIPPNFVHKRNIAFAGQLSTLSNPACTTVQALWISAFFDGELKRLSSDNEEILDEVFMHTQWSRWRYPCGYGPSMPDIPFDCVPYHDLLLNDMGINPHRRSGTLADLFQSYGPSDYDGMVEEYMNSQVP